MADTKYIFVTGDVVSSLGKGIISASLGELLQVKGYKVTIQKFDLYISVDPGTPNPYEHGECHAAVDGHEVDLDLDHYERFLNVQTTCANNITTGRIYQSVINKKRKGDYLGKTVQVVPHITDEIKCNVKLLGGKYKFDFAITGVGGTAGDIESLPLTESVCQLKWELDKNCPCVHLTYVLYIVAAEEYKTKPTQHPVKQLQELGIQSDVLVLRTEYGLNTNLLRKMALFCNVAEDSVIQPIDVPTTYEVPLVLQRQKMGEVVLRKAGMEVGPTPELRPWKEFFISKSIATDTVKIGLVGKYAELQSAYKSIDESLLRAAIYNHHRLDLHLFHSEKLNNENAAEQLKDMDDILIVPGFGQKGTEGKFAAIKYAREHGVPCLGICLGMQCMVIEFVRDILGLMDANSTEMEPNTTHKVTGLMEEQKNVTNMGGSMRLGAYDCTLKEGSKVLEVYGKEHVQERHRRRFELNNEYKKQYEAAGMMCTGENPETNLVEVVEIPVLKWFVGVQYHPEYNSTVVNPNPLFLSFVRAATENKR